MLTFPDEKTPFTVLLCLLTLFTSTSLGQSSSAGVSTVETLGAIPATQVLSGLGWNLSPVNAWEFQAAAAAGAKHARFQCSWGDAYGGHGGGGELQSPPPANVSGGYQVPAGCAQGIALSKQYGLKPTILAAYGPPFQQILTLTTTAPAAAGATAVQVGFVSGVGGDTLSTVAYPYDYLSAPNIPGFLSPAHSYAGTLLSGSTLKDATHATLSLASATQVAIPSGTTLVVNRVLYPSAATNSATDPSVLAYVGFVRFLGSQCVSAGIACEIEIWNEPAWPDECWDNRRDCFDYGATSSFNEEYFGPNWGFVAALQSTPPMPGVTFDWAGTHKSGDGTVLGPNMAQYAGGAVAAPGSAITVESLHPYGNNPEDNMWNEPCFVALKTTSNWGACNTISTSSSNAGEGEARSILARQTNPNGGINHAITETGFPGTVGDDAHKARFTTRQFLGFMAANVQFLEFYRMYDTDPSTNFSFMSYTNGTPAALPAYTAAAGLMTDLKAIPNAPVTPIASSSLPTVANYSGTYPLDIAHFVGSRPGDTANSDFVTLWQRSFAPASPGWSALASPPGGPVTLALPSGTSVKQIINLDTRAQVAYTTAGQQVSFSVSDDPIEVLLEPSPAQAPLAATLLVNPVSSAYGTASVLAVTQLSFSGTAMPSGSFGFSVDGGPSQPATCTGVSSPLVCSASLATGSLAVGTHALVASVTADTHYGAALSSSTLTITRANLALSIPSLTVPYGTPSISLTARVSYPGPAAPTGVLSFAVNGGPAIAATCVGSTSPLICTAVAASGTLAVGNHTLSVSFAPDPNYNAGSATGNLTITSAGPPVSSFRGLDVRNAHIQ